MISFIDSTLILSLSSFFQQLLQNYPQLAEVIPRKLSENQQQLVQRQQKIQELGLSEAENTNNFVILLNRIVNNIKVKM